MHRDIDLIDGASLNHVGRCDVLPSQTIVLGNMNQTIVRPSPQQPRYEWRLLESEDRCIDLDAGVVARDALTT